MVNSNRKGTRKERELTNKLDDRGFAVLRAPASGSATARNLPDVLAGNGDVFVAIEAKASSGRPIYLDAAEIDALDHFATNFGATALVAARFNRVPWAFFPIPVLHVTDGGNYRVKQATAETPTENGGVTIDGLASVGSHSDGE